MMAKQRGVLRKFASVEGVCAIALLSVIILMSLLAPVLAPYPPTQVDMSSRLQPASGAHWLGTDTLGRDMLSRILYGGRGAILLAIAATAMTMLLGLVIGMAAGYFGGAVDGVAMSVASMFQGLPGISFMIAIASILGPGAKSLLISIVITSWAGFARIVRAETLRQREENYIEGVRNLGACAPLILLRHILPNMLSSIIVLFTTRVGRVVLSIASLSFLGLGLQPPTPDWSVMISDARTHFRSAPHTILAPGLCIVALTLGINLLGDVLRDVFDVRSEDIRAL